MDRAEKVRLDDLAEHVGRCGFEGSVTVNGGITHAHVDPPEGFNCRAHEDFYLGFVADIGRHGDYLRPTSGAFGGDFFKVFGVPCRENEPGTAFGESMRGGPADAAGSTGDDDHRARSAVAALPAHRHRLRGRAVTAGMGLAGTVRDPQQAFGDHTEDRVGDHASCMCLPGVLLGSGCQSQCRSNDLVVEYI